MHMGQDAYYPGQRLSRGSLPTLFARDDDAGRQLLAQFHADHFAEGQFRSEQQSAAFAGAHVHKAEGLHAAARRERIDPAPAHLAENRRSHGGIAGEVSVVRMAGDEVALAEVSGGVQAVPLIEGMLDIAKRRSGSDRGDRSHQNLPAMSVARLEPSSSV